MSYLQVQPKDGRVQNLDNIDLHYSQQPDEVSLRPISSEDPSEHDRDSELDIEHGIEIEELKEVENENENRPQPQQNNQLLRVSSIQNAL